MMTCDTNIFFINMAEIYDYNNDGIKVIIDNSVWQKSHYKFNRKYKV